MALKEDGTPMDPKECEHKNTIDRKVFNVKLGGVKITKVCKDCDKIIFNPTVSSSE